ncbi:MAG: hemolysin family protein [Alphaproteobacteria bacterium]
MNTNQTPEHNSETSEQRQDEEPPSLWRKIQNAKQHRRQQKSLHKSINNALKSLPKSQAILPLDDAEQTIFHNLILRKNRAIEEHMIPRADIIALDIKTSRSDALKIIRECGHSRLPVFQDSLDHIFGFLHVKDLLRETTPNSQPDTDLKDLLRPVIFAAPSMRNLNLLRLMRVRRTHLALVVDEFGGVDGLITSEDLIEELIGEIEDEHDLHDQQPEWKQLADGSFIADASIRIDELPENIRKTINAETNGEDIDTLGGFAAWLAGRVPRNGEVILHETSGWKFIILQASPRRILRLRLIAK